ncbi:hypothetical protein [Modestobacter versicolor]|uniref:Uncharacterized protein n=1 Tax=Modestobacter versicolor TaxID=429133 RepID=A0A323V8X1_9ACTN|nr:hypothetical protein [Modestobacter versicolor]MBB3677088.1 hypothetical protein [Modestobacter versicolor]PZA20520.1 hypothetical protein DMO24_15005 [Modestobacter versicolor]
MSLPSGHGPAPATAAAGTAWWLVDVDSRVVAGPFGSRVDAALAELSSSPRDELDVLVPAHGTRRDDGTLAPRFSPDDRAWLAHLSEQLDRLADDWDALIDDADPLTGLVCEIAAAVAEAGLPLHDCAGRTPSRQLGGVCLTPAPGEQGVLVTWTQHDRMALGRVRGHAADLAAQQVMNHAVAGVLTAFGFLVEPFGEASGHVVRGADDTPGLTAWD